MTKQEYQKWYTELHREEKLKRSREWYLQNKEVYNLRRKKLFYYVSSAKVKKKFGTLQEVCDFMGYSKPTICRYIKAGRKLEGYKITKGVR